MEARQVSGLQAPQNCQGTVWPLRHQRLHIIQRPAISHWCAKARHSKRQWKKNASHTRAFDIYKNKEKETKPLTPKHGWRIRNEWPPLSFPFIKYSNANCGDREPHLPAFYLKILYNGQGTITNRNKGVNTLRNFQEAKEIMIFLHYQLCVFFIEKEDFFLFLWKL